MRNATPTAALSGKYATAPNGCHVWQRALNSRGYGVVWFDGKVRLAHRVAFLAKHGRWPADDKVTDHACDTKACVNPDHLRELENWRNVRRAVTPASTEAQQRRREAWRRANARRRNYSETWTPEGGE